MKQNNFSAFILTSDNKPTRALKNVLAFFSINPEQSLEELVKITQEKWLRTEGSERWHSEQKTIITPESRDLFCTIGMINAVQPPVKNYDYILLLGSDLSGTQARINFLLNLWTQGVRTQNSIALGSDRPLADHELQSKIEIGSTEIEMLQKLFEHAALPKDFSKIIFINTKILRSFDGTHKRASTGDTIDSLLATNPKPGSCLLISDQPFIGYQDAVAHFYLNQQWQITSCGPAADNQTMIEDLLDTLGRWLYQENQNKIKSS